MATQICRPFITLRNGRVLWAWEKGLKAFCFTVEEERPKAKRATVESKRVIAKTN
jgi:hypothetical protein